MQVYKTVNICVKVDYICLYINESLLMQLLVPSVQNISNMHLFRTTDTQ